MHPIPNSASPRAPAPESLLTFNLTSRPPVFGRELRVFRPTGLKCMGFGATMRSLHVFTGSSKLTNITPLPAQVPRAVAVSLLQDHDFFLHCDPHYASHKELAPPAGAEVAGAAERVRQEYKLPEDVVPLAHGGGGDGDGDGQVYVKLYEVVDHVPNPVWSSNVVSKEEFVDFADGLWVRIRSPMGVVMETKWFVREKKEGGGGLELVEDVDVSCTKLLLGIVKGQVENNWKGIHERIVKRMVEDAEKK
ncbi:hypothetical protein F5Y15DRAFT_416854 [Xylariaceae sp. FL0016]|nr:hypothetical protein F5Y15DRAFT_416854 [Xylariaceae sp. FL0016]